MAVIPIFLAGAEVCDPAIGKFFGGVVKAFVFSFGERVMVDGGLEKITGDVALMLAAIAGRPSLGPAVAIGEGVRGLQISVRLLLMPQLG